MKQVIYYAEEDARKAAEELLKTNTDYSLKGSELDYSFDVEESDAFAELKPGGWAGSVSAYAVEDEKFDTIAKFGWWCCDETVGHARARKRTEGAIATWNAGEPFKVGDSTVEEMADIIADHDTHTVLEYLGASEGERKVLCSQLGIDPDEGDDIDVYTKGDKKLTIRYAEDF